LSSSAVVVEFWLELIKNFMRILRLLFLCSIVLSQALKIVTMRPNINKFNQQWRSPCMKYFLQYDNESIDIMKMKMLVKAKPKQSENIIDIDCVLLIKFTMSINFIWILERSFKIDFVGVFNKSVSLKALNLSRSPKTEQRNIVIQTIDVWKHQKTRKHPWK
jgi:hypothetical protein